MVDPRDASTFVNFVAAAAIDGHFESRAKAAKALGMKRSNLTTALRTKPTLGFLRKVERVYLELGDTSHRGAPWLTTFKTEMEQVVPGRGVVPVTIPAGWFYNLGANAPRNSTEAFVRAHALHAFVQEIRGATSDADIGAVLENFGLTEKADATIDDLLEVVGGPPHTALPAVQLLVSLDSLMLQRTGHFIRTSPVGFRAIRVLGRMLAEAKVGRGRESLVEVGDLLRALHEEGPVDPYPARSFLVEALRYAPQVAGWEWVTQTLVERTELSCAFEEHPVRERAYAAFVLQDRGHLDEARRAADAFRQSGDDGLRYAAAYLDLHDPETGRPSNFDWPTGTIEHGIVDDATFEMNSDDDVPLSVRQALRDLTRTALLSIDGTQRRKICESIQASLLAPAAIRGISRVIDEPSAPGWLVEHAAFITAYLQTGLPVGASSTCEQLASVLDDDRRHDAARHAAAWGLGDVLGSLDDPPDPKRFGDLLSRRATEERDVRVSRALAYATAMLSRRAPLNRSGTMAQLEPALKQFERTKDPLVKKLAAWAREIQQRRHQNKGYLAWAEADPAS